MGELPIEELKKIADTVIEGIGRLDVSPCFALSGGEPFLRDDLFDLIDYLHQKGGSTVIMETTGTLLTPDVTALLVEHSPPVTAIQVSLDGGRPSIHDMREIVIKKIVTKYIIVYFFHCCGKKIKENNYNRGNSCCIIGAALVKFFIVPT